MRVVMLGCGTGVGKTHVSRALLESLTRSGLPTLGLKPIETGIANPNGENPPPGSDAAALARASGLQSSAPHPRYSFAEPISPHLAARRDAREVEIAEVAAWVGECEREIALSISPDMVPYVVIESAGGVFSPVSPKACNFDLARALEPAIWVVVAADALGVLHDVTAALEAMRARGRAPDYVVLSEAREADASTGTNASELSTLGIAHPIAVLSRGNDDGIAPLVHALIARGTQ